MELNFVSDTHKDILRHMLGLGFSDTPCRNFIRAYDRSADLPELFNMARLGLIRRIPANMLGYVFEATQQGIDVVMKKEEPSTPK